VVDRIVEDVTRRKQGEFFTPAIWVDKAHEYIASVYGDDWKEKYVVWDPAWGTGNLTRDYKFKELYASTLNQSDIDTANQMGYNPEAVKFQYDFLNDDYEKLPEGLRKAIEEGRQIIVLMNPPYGSSTNLSYDSKTKEGIAISKINKLMNNQKLGHCSQNLYSQFIYRTKFFGLDMCMFTPVIFYSGPTYKNLRTEVFKKYKFAGGYIMNASNFADVKSWGLSFSILLSVK
jgi:predicted RNA methylase